jgi:hypothetical protein
MLHAHMNLMQSNNDLFNFLCNKIKFNHSEDKTSNDFGIYKMTRGLPACCCGHAYYEISNRI